MLMCRHRKQIWRNWEYRLFLTGMHDEEKRALVIPAVYQLAKQAVESLLLA
jgi:hypothetical protein